MIILSMYIITLISGLSKVFTIINLGITGCCVYIGSTLRIQSISFKGIYIDFKLLPFGDLAKMPTIIREDGVEICEIDDRKSLTIGYSSIVSVAVIVLTIGLISDYNFINVLNNIFIELKCVFTGSTGGIKWSNLLTIRFIDSLVYCGVIFTVINSIPFAFTPIGGIVIKRCSHAILVRIYIILSALVCLAILAVGSIAVFA